MEFWAGEKQSCVPTCTLLLQVKSGLNEGQGLLCTRGETFQRNVFWGGKEAFKHLIWGRGGDGAMELKDDLYTLNFKDIPLSLSFTTSLLCCPTGDSCTESKGEGMNPRVRGQERARIGHNQRIDLTLWYVP